MSNHASLPGFRDFYPAEFAARTHMVSAWREASVRHGFEEYDGPPLESLELYTEKSGEEIVAQLYHFVDKGGRAVALRPEMTPTLARMVGARAGGLRKPIRWFSIPQLFRYERTQRGRLREHFQWNVDIIGEEDVAADAEVLATGLDALALLGLDGGAVVARYSDRRLLEAILLNIGIAPDHLAGTYAAIDKLGREPRDQIAQKLAGAGLAAPVVERVLMLFDEPGLDALSATWQRVEGVRVALDRLERYRTCLAELGHGDSVQFDLSIVRGLAYYTGTVFEIFDRAGALRAICGGGRYDRLLASVSRADLPAVGFGMGDVVLAELLHERGLLPEYRARIDVFVIAVSEAQQAVQRQVATRLRSAGRAVAYSLSPASVARQFKEAHARGAARAIVIGPAEVEENVIVVKEMDTGTERRMSLDALLAEP